MNLKNLLRSIKVKFLSTINPIEYAYRVGVNFHRGGGMPLWKDFLGYRTLDHYIR